MMKMKIDVKIDRTSRYKDHLLAPLVQIAGCLESLGSEGQNEQHDVTYASKLYHSTVYQRERNQRTQLMLRAFSLARKLLNFLPLESFKPFKPDPRLPVHRWEFKIGHPLYLHDGVNRPIASGCLGLEHVTVSLVGCHS